MGKSIRWPDLARAILRGRVERERRLHGVMARAAFETLRVVLVEAASEPEAVPGAVIALQTFGSFGANFHPHLHGIATDGACTRDGLFPPVVWPAESELMERFRKTYLLYLERAERLLPGTRARLIAWQHAGFSVKTTQWIAAGERQRLERLARYATRVVVAVGAVKRAGPHVRRDDANHGVRDAAGGDRQDPETLSGEAAHESVRVARTAGGTVDGSWNHRGRKSEPHTCAARHRYVADLDGVPFRANRISRWQLGGGGSSTSSPRSGS